MTHHILVVEDNVSTRELYVDILEAYDFKVEVLLNGQEVLDYFDAPENPRPDLLMLDINLPEKNGVYVLKYLRGKLKLHKQKILVITANHIAGQMPEMALANHIMTKPFLPKQLKETIDMVLNAPDRDIEIIITGETESITVTRENIAIKPAEPEAKSDQAETVTPPAEDVTDTPEIDSHKAVTVETKAVTADDADTIEPDDIEEETANADPTPVDSVGESVESTDAPAVEDVPPTGKIDTTNSAETSKSEAVTVETKAMSVAEPASSDAPQSTTPESSADITNVEEKAG